MNSNATTPYHPSRRHGWAFKYLNFAGRGFRFNLGARPRSHWDFNSKIHDLMFYVNDIKFDLLKRSRGKKRSKLEKADYIFREMSKDIERTNRSEHEFMLNNMAKIVFVGKDRSRFRDDDGFKNIIHFEDISPDHGHLMIPWSEIPNQEQTQIQNQAKERARDIAKELSLSKIRKCYRINTNYKYTRRRGKRVRAESLIQRKNRIIRLITEELKYNTPASIDETPWREWANGNFPQSWPLIISI